jgi:hypothetical protein
MDAYYAYAKDGRYFKFGGEPYNWMANWHGLPPRANARGGMQLGDTPVETGPAPAGPGLGPFGMSQSEMRLAVVGLLGFAGFVWWKKVRPRRARR